MKAVTVRQPWASLIAAGVKTIETRPRQTGYRGRIAIHAAAREPFSRLDAGRAAGARQEVGGWLTWWAGGEAQPRWCMANPEGRVVADPLPLGAVVASAVLTDCVPIINETDPTPDGPFVYADLGNFVQVHDGPDDSVPRYSETEVHLGDFSPGRWALLLDDIKPTTERCPWCWGDGGFKVDSMTLYGIPGGEDWGEMCEVCQGKGMCDPVSARGQQAVPWEWQPTSPR